MTTDMQDTPAAPPPAEPDTREKALQELAAEAQAWGFYDPPGAPSSAPAQEGEALRTALKRIVVPVAPMGLTPLERQMVDALAELSNVIKSRMYEMPHELAHGLLAIARQGLAAPTVQQEKPE